MPEKQFIHGFARSLKYKFILKAVTSRGTWERSPPNLYYDKGAPSDILPRDLKIPRSTTGG